MRIIIDIEPCQDGDGIDVTIGEHTFANQGAIDVENYCRIAVSNALDALDALSEAGSKVTI